MKAQPLLCPDVFCWHLSSNQVSTEGSNCWLKHSFTKISLWRALLPVWRVCVWTKAALMLGSPNLWTKRIQKGEKWVCLTSNIGVKLWDSGEPSKSWFSFSASPVFSPSLVRSFPSQRYPQSTEQRLVTSSTHICPTWLNESGTGAKTAQALIPGWCGHNLGFCAISSDLRSFIWLLLAAGSLSVNWSGLVVMIVDCAGKDTITVTDWNTSTNKGHAHPGISVSLNSKLYRAENWLLHGLDSRIRHH